MKGLYDYKANAPGELSVNVNDLLLVFDKEDAWLLVRVRQREGKLDLCLRYAMLLIDSLIEMLSRCCAGGYQ